MDKKILFFTAVFFLSICLVSVYGEESISITAYYPSPYGSYNQLQTNSFGVGDNNNNGVLDSADVPTNAGDVWIHGNLGVGTTDPRLAMQVGEKFGIAPSDAPYDSVNLVYNASFEAPGWRMLSNGYPTAISLTNTRPDLIPGSIAFYTGPSMAQGTGFGGAVFTTKMIIANDGNVGIGTVTPAEKLDVNGDIIVRSNVASNCTWTNYFVGNTFICPNGQFIAGVRDATSDGFIDGLYCCDL